MAIQSILSQTLLPHEPVQEGASTNSAATLAQLVTIAPNYYGNNLIKPVSDVIAQKKANMQRSLKNKMVRYHPGMIAGDGLTMAYTAFTGFQYFFPSLQTLSWVGWVTGVAGEIGGLINIWVAFQEFKEAYTAIQNNDRLNAIKMIFDASFFTLIGVLMILVSLAVKISALGGLAGFFTANPWLLPVLFFVVTIPLILEIGYRVKFIALKADLAAQMHLQEIKNAFENKHSAKAMEHLHTTPFAPLFNADPSPRAISEKMEELQADMGVEAAIEVFTLFQMIIEGAKENSILDQLKIAEQRIAEWHRAQYIRLFQQVLYIIAFAISMGAFAPNANANLINGSDNMTMAAANLVPLYMDIAWPFKRNVPMVVPKVDIHEAV